MNMDRGLGVTGFGMCPMGWVQKMYHLFYHCVRYMGFVSKVRNHDRIGNDRNKLIRG